MPPEDACAALVHYKPVGNDTNVEGSISQVVTWWEPHDQPQGNVPSGKRSKRTRQHKEGNIKLIVTTKS